MARQAAWADAIMVSDGALRLLRQPMPRYRITIEYDGTPFVGWQIQANEPVRPGRADARRSSASRGETVAVKGAGRTDAGVHALGQVAHFDLAKDWDPFRVREAMNFHLKPAARRRARVRRSGRATSMPASAPRRATTSIAS